MAAGADAVIVDLEDAVAPAKKTEARAAIGKWLSAKRGSCCGSTRTRPSGTGRICSWHALWGFAGILLSKAQSIDGALQAICVETGKFLLPQVETAQGFENAYALASVPGVQRLLFGTLDFQVDLGIEGEGDELAYFRSELVWFRGSPESRPRLTAPAIAL